MDGDNWTTVITTLVTVGATLTGVGLTQRHATTLRRLDHHQQRRVEQRVALADVLATGRDWAENLIELGFASTGKNPPTLSELDQRLKHHRPSEEKHRRALLTARLVVLDEQVFAHVTQLSQEAEALVAATADVEMRVLRPDTHSAAAVSDPATGQPVPGLHPVGHDLVRLGWEYRDRLVDLENLTRDRVVNERQAPHGRRRLRLRADRS